MVSKRLKFVLRLAISCLFCGYLAVKVDWALILHALKQIDLLLYAASTLLTIAASFFLACKYYLLIRSTPISRSIPSLIKINLISRFYALFLPSAVGPEAVRWYKVTRNQKGRAFFLAATVFERLTFLFVLLLFGAIPLFFYSSHAEIAMLRGRIIPVVIVSLGVISLSITYYVFPAIRSFFNSIIDRNVTWRLKHVDIASFLRNFSLKKPKPSLYAYIFGLSLIWQIFFLGRLFILFKSAALPLDFLDVAWMGSLVLLLQVLPISFAGIGVREGAYAYLFTVFNLPPERGVLIGILFFSQMLILAAVGGLLELTARR